ncbi:hypothetical protein EYB25_003210 [Talaromyces marneffei]|nr:hypothetical protein EYB25_003210 [Talaromyces marneffei]
MEGMIVYILVLCTQLATASVLGARLQAAAVPQATHVAVGGNNGSSFFDPSRLSLLPGDEVIFDCYEDNMWLLKATIDFSHIDSMPSVLLCQRNITLTMRILDQEPHIYYSPAIPGGSYTNMTLFLNQPSQSPSPSPSHHMPSSTVLIPPYPTVQGSGKASYLNTGTMPLSTGRLISTKPQSTHSVPTSHFPVAPTHASTLATSTPSTSDAQTSAIPRAWIAIVSVIVMFII